MKLSPVRTLFTTSYEAYRAAMWHLIALEVLPLLVMLAIGTLSFAAILAGATAAAVAIIIIGVVLTIIISIAVSIAMIERVAKPRPTLQLRKSLEATREIFLPYLFVGILVALCVIVGFILFIIPAIIVGVWLSFSYFILVLERKHGVEALKVSKEYVRGLWFPVFGRIAALIFVVMLFMMVCTFIVELFFGKGAVTDTLMTIVNLIVSPFSLVYLFNLYTDVKRAKHRPSHEPDAVLA